MGRKLRIAILGTRGIPARYGGFETFAEQLSLRLLSRGHEVLVYGRWYLGDSPQKSSDYLGVTTIPTFTIRQKYVETPLNAITASLDLIRRDVDVVLMCNAANAPMAWILKCGRLPLAINVDGIERRRTKWSKIGKAWYRLGEICSVLFADSVISDAYTIEDYYLETYGCSSDVIPYGSTVTKREAGSTLAEFGLTPGEYILYVSRMEPENNALGVVQAYNQSKVALPLVMVGDAPYAKEYIDQVKQAAGPGVIFTGYQFAERYQELQTHAYMYIQGSEVGGTHPALVEAMGYGNCIIANGTPEHIEVLGGAGAYYFRNDFSDLSRQIEFLVKKRDVATSYGVLAEERAQKLFSWEAVTDKYESLFNRLVDKNTH